MLETNADTDFKAMVVTGSLPWWSLMAPRTEIDVFDVFSLRRSLRRGSDSQAIAQQVAPDDIDLNNRWRRVEQAGSRKATFQKMRQHYADVRILLPALLRYSRAL